MRRSCIPRKLGAAVLIAAYLASTAWFQFLHVLGDSTAHPVSYFWTWDMFPGYRSGSRRREAVGRTKNGKYIRLYPGRSERYRGGVHSDLTRLDILPTVESEPVRSLFRRAVESTLKQARHAHRDDPLVHIHLFERYWAPRFNLPDDLYESSYDDPRPRHKREYWRSVGEANIDPHGRVTWSPPP